MATTPFNGNVIFNGQAAFTSADTTTAKQIYPSGSGVPICTAIMITSTDSVDRKVRLFYRKSSTNYLIGSVDVPAGTGTGGTPPINALDSSHLNFPNGLPLAAADTLQASMEATLTAATELDITCYGVM